MRPDGSEFPVELVTSVLADGPPVFTAYLRDITDRQRAERELIESKARIVESADRERKRIERNLHDGAQQRLVAILLMLRRMSQTSSLRPCGSPSPWPRRRRVEPSRSFASSSGASIRSHSRSRGWEQRCGA